MRVERYKLDDDGAYVDAYIADPIPDFTRKAILVIPGGGYANVCSDREGEPIAHAFMPYGYNAFVLHYYTGKEKPFPIQLIQAAKAIKLIKDKIDVPFVMHGGSGLSKEEFQTAIRNGIRKINYYTYMTLAGGKAVKDALAKVGEGENVFYHDIPLISIEAMKKNVVEAIKIFSLEV